MQEIVGCTLYDLAAGLTNMEASLPVGGRTQVELCTEILPAQDAIEEFYTHATDNGFHMSRPQTKIIGGVPTTSFVLIKGSPEWAALITFIPVIITGALVAFGLARIETIAKAITPLALILVSGAVIIAIAVRKPVR